MKKVVVALAFSLMAASAPLAPASADFYGCPKNLWLYQVDGEYMDGWGIVGLVQSITGAETSFTAAVQWLSQHGYRIVVVDRYYCYD